MTGRDRIEAGGIIAAGAGNRLRAGGIDTPKPLTPIAGRPLIGHAIDNLLAAGARHLAMIFNEADADCAAWVGDAFPKLDADIVIKTTPSSYASFRVIADLLAGRRALITTVDSWYVGGGFAALAARAAAYPADAIVLGASDFVDDEKPLWIEFDEATGEVTSLGNGSGGAATCGFYLLPARMPPADGDFDRLRDYLRSLFDAGVPMFAAHASMVIDVDRVEDLALARDSARAIEPKKEKKP